jgi:transcriptional regulator with XRE-family HTH domain
MKIGRSIRIILEATKLTRGQLAQRLGISKSYLSCLEHNKVTGGRQILEKIEKVFGVAPIFVIAASDLRFKEKFPRTYYNIKVLIEVIAATRMIIERASAA